MAIIQGNAKQGSTRGFYPKVINGSLRFNDDDSAYLSWTPASAGNQKTFTISFWLKMGLIPTSSSMNVLGTGTNNTEDFMVGISYDAGRLCRLMVISRQSGSVVAQVETNSQFRDPSAWYHFVISVDTTQATPSNRIKIYVNGVHQTSLNVATYPSPDLNFRFNSANVHRIGTTRDDQTTSNTLDGYLANVHFLNGIAATADDFGELKNGVWVAKDYTGLFDSAAETALGHANGFYLTFEDDTQVEAFNTVLYRGNGGTQSITGVGFQPDLVWVKERDDVVSHLLADSVRGADKTLSSDLTASEVTGSRFVSFDSDGFTVGATGASNGSADKYVAWCWKAGGSSNTYNVDGTGYATASAAGITDGTLPLTGLSVSTTYGFSICTFNSGASGTQTFAHGLGTTPSLCIFKERNSGGAGDHWVVWEGMTGNPATSYGYLNLTNAFGTDTSQWSNTAPTSTEFTFNSGYAWSTSQNMIAYCWAEKSGYSKFDSFTGEGANNTTISKRIYTTNDGTSSGTGGFRPSMIIFKRTDSASVNGWYLFDSTRDTDAVVGYPLYPDQNYAEGGTDDVIQFNDDGFTIVRAYQDYCGAGGTYIYAAFADTREAAFWLDQSGNDNDWQPVNLDHNDTVADSPTNNFATMNPLQVATSGAPTFADGNLEVTTPVSGAGIALSTIGVTSGKYYAEVTPVSINSLQRSIVGITGDADATITANTNIGSLTSSLDVGYFFNGTKFVGNVETSGYGASYDVGDVIGIALNVDDSEVTFYKNGVSQGAISFTSGGTYHFAYCDGSAGAGGTARVNFGQQPFKYDPPA